MLQWYKGKTEKKKKDLTEESHFRAVLPFACERGIMSLDILFLSLSGIYLPLLA